jgi:Tol biopolymer transport system component
MADFTGKLERLSVRGTPVGVEELIERIEAELAGDPLIVVTQRRKGIVMTKTDQLVTSKGPGPGRGFGWAVAAFVAILALGGIYLAFGEDDGEVVDQDIFPVPTTIEGTFLLDLGTGEQTPLTELVDETFFMSASPDGTTLFAQPCCTGADVAMLANVDGTNQRRLDPPDTLNYYGARWSPDGTKIVYQARIGSTNDVGNLFVEDVASGEQTQVTDFEPTTAYWWYLSPTFSGDGENVYFHRPRGEAAVTEFDVWSVSVTGGEPTLVMENAAQWVPLPNEEPSAAFVLPAPDSFFGSSIMLTTRNGPRTLLETEGGISFPSASPDGSRIVYMDADSIYVVDVATGESSQVAEGNMASWLDDDTLAVAPTGG